jgi:hypothetical protein
VEEVMNIGEETEETEEEEVEEEAKEEEDSSEVEEETIEMREAEVGITKSILILKHIKRSSILKNESKMSQIHSLIIKKLLSLSLTLMFQNKSL